MRYVMIAVFFLSMPAMGQQADTRFCQNVTMNADGTITIRERSEFMGRVLTNTKLAPGMLVVGPDRVDLHGYIRKLCAP